MPNTAALVNQACSVFVRGTTATDEDANLVDTLLKSIGTCEEVTESLIDAITGLSGSGPAYVYIMIESLADGGVKMGLPRDMAYRLASQTVLGAGLLVRDSERHPGQLKDDVTSPAGSTAAGIYHLEKHGKKNILKLNREALNRQSMPIILAFRSTVAGAVEAATEKCRETSTSKQ